MRVDERVGGDERVVVALVGHCGPDSFMLRSSVRRAIPGADIVSFESDRDVEREAPSADILLVNRLMDGRFEDASGIELIRRLREDLGERGPAMILVSNFEDAQREAEKAGAMPGFGKRDLHDDTTRERLLAAASARGHA